MQAEADYKREALKSCETQLPLRTWKLKYFASFKRVLMPCEICRTQYLVASRSSLHRNGDI